MTVAKAGETCTASAHADLSWWVTQGVIGGVIAGLILAVFELIVVALLKRIPSSTSCSMAL